MKSYNVRLSLIIDVTSQEKILNIGMKLGNIEYRLDYICAHSMWDVIDEDLLTDILAEAIYLWGLYKKELFASRQSTTTTSN